MTRFSGTDDGIAASSFTLGASSTSVARAFCVVELEHLSVHALIVTQDGNGDGVPDAFGPTVDLCEATAIPEGAPTVALRVNRFALTDGDTIFDTTSGRRGRRSTGYSLDDTAGGSCEQIVAAWNLGAGQLRYGCSDSVLSQWVGAVSP